MLLRFLFKLILGLLFGAAVAMITYKVVTKITFSNLAENIRRAIRNSKEDAFRKLLGHQIKVAVKKKSSNAVSISVLEADVAEAKNAEIKIESTEGVDNTVFEGLKLSMTA